MSARSTRRLIRAALLVLVAGLGTGQRLNGQKPADRNAGQAPIFEVDPFWPKPLPNHWNLGPIAGAWVDDQDHIWFMHRSRSVPVGERGLDMKPPFSEICCAAAPPVLEFDQAGNLLRHWGGPAPRLPWTIGEHGLSIDHKGNVWIGGQGGGDSAIIKYTKDGKFLMQVGKTYAHLPPGTAAGGRAASTGRLEDPADSAGPSPSVYQPDSLDMENFGRPTKIVVNAKTNEAFVSDGYLNKRIVVLDADTGAFKRIWGGYGNKPDDTIEPGPRNPLRANDQPSDRGAAHNPNAPPPPQFRNPVHCVMLSRDDLVYVCDRQGDRVQVFTTAGKFVKETLILPKTMNQGSVWDIAFSSDPEQTFMYVADGENMLIHILRRDTLEELTAFGDGGRQPGQLFGTHVIATDSKGNLYTGDWGGQRIQKFVYKGLGPVTRPYQGTVWPKR
jgi:DNA-binding beta-propeller fold protein YncE